MSIRIHRALGFGVLVLWAGACTEDDALGKGRADSGLISRDAGFNAPLALQVGWTFSYRATLTKRQGNQEQNSAYDINFTITAVDDNGPQSTITVAASGANTFQQNWEQTAGIDSWVALIGPANREDQVSAAPTIFDIEKPPTTPSKRPPKTLPHPGIFFLDMRNIENIRNSFNELYVNTGPSSRAPDPSSQRIDWVLQLSGMDEELSTFPSAANQREMTIEYDTRGFLTKMNERLGDSFDTLNPNGNYTLTLVSERPSD
jgi:hypothetical protein